MSDHLVGAGVHGLTHVEVRVLLAHVRGSPEVLFGPDPHGPVGAEHLLGEGGVDP